MSCRLLYEARPYVGGLAPPGNEPHELRERHLDDPGRQRRRHATRDRETDSGDALRIDDLLRPSIGLLLYHYRLDAPDVRLRQAVYVPTGVTRSAARATVLRATEQQRL